MTNRHFYSPDGPFPRGEYRNGARERDRRFAAPGKPALTAARHIRRLTLRRGTASLHFQRQYARAAIGDLQSPVLKRVLGLWHAKREGRPFPCRDDLRPRDFAPFLRLLSLARRTETGDFEIRIVGDEIVESYGENFRGRTLSSLEDVIGEEMIGAYRAAVEERAPILLQGSFERANNQRFLREVLLMPVGSAGKVDFVLSASVLIKRIAEYRIAPRHAA